MAFNDEDGAANNGFPRRSLHAWEGHLLHQAGYPCPPDTRPPGGGWRLSAGGVPIPPPPRGHALDVAIEEARMTMTDEERADPRHHPDNYTRWNSFFLRRWERELASYDGPPPPPPRNNAAGRRRWWSAPNRTLENVLEHIEGGNFPVLTMPPPSRASASRRRGNSWQPRRMAASSSSSGSASRSLSRSAPSLAPVKKEAASPPSTRARGSGGIVIREPSTAQGRLRPKREPDTSGERKRKPAKVKVEEAESAEDAAILEAVMARSLQDLVPAENAMPLDKACAWSREQWEKEEAERQARLLEDVARYRWPATPPSGAAIPVIDLDASDDDWYKPSPSPPRTSGRWGDAGQGSSQAASAPAQFDDDGSDDDGGDGDMDYTVFYRHLGM